MFPEYQGFYFINCSPEGTWWVIKRNLPPGMTCIQLEVWQWCGAYETIWIFLLMVYFSVVSLPAIGRTLIPRYFSTVFEGGVTDLYYILKHSKESYHNSSITVDCDQCAMVTQHGKPMFTKVQGRLGNKPCSSLGALKHSNYGCLLEL